MSPLRKLIYILLGFFAVAVLGTLLAWTFTKKPVFFTLSLVLFVLFTAYFVFFLLYNRKTGWKGEKTLLARVESEEKLLLSILPAPNKAYYVNVYKTERQELLLEALKRDPEGNGDDPIEEDYLGYLKVKPKELGAFRGKTVLIEAALLRGMRDDGALSVFLKKNEFLTYRGKK